MRLDKTAARAAVRARCFPSLKGLDEIKDKVGESAPCEEEKSR